MAAREQYWIVQAVGRAGWLGAQIVASPSKPPNSIGGPYPTKAAAEAELNKRTENRKSGPPIIPNPLAALSPLEKIGHWVGTFVAHLTDGAMWRSLGWMLLGAVLIFSGVYLWFRTSATYDELQGAVLGAVKAAA